MEAKKQIKTAPANELLRTNLSNPGICWEIGGRLQELIKKSMEQVYGTAVKEVKRDHATYNSTSKTANKTEGAWFWYTTSLDQNTEQNEESQRRLLDALRSNLEEFGFNYNKNTRKLKDTKNDWRINLRINYEQVDL